MDENPANQEARELLELLRDIESKITPLIRYASPQLAMELGSIVERIGHAVDRARTFELMDHGHD